MTCELLENRRLLSATLESSGVLVINGTYKDDLITLRVVNGRLGVTDNGAASSFIGSAVKSIRVNLRGGNDSFDAVSIGFPIWIEGRLGNDTIVGGNRPDTIYGNEGNDSIIGGNSNDAIYGGSGANIVRGGGGNDLFVTEDESAQVYGGRGNDTLRGGSGADMFSGQDGTDTMDYSGHSEAVTVRLNGVADDGAPGERDNIATSVEHIIGTRYDDGIYGGAGPIEIEGGEGDDTLMAGAEDSLLDGGLGNDRIGGRGGDDTIYGGEGNDSFDGGRGTDEFHGGDGLDSVSYALRSENLVLRVSGNSESGAEGENDLIGLDMEDIRGGSGNDLFVGSDSPETFYGRDGDDTIDGGWGNDTLWGGSGIDTGDYSSRTMLQQLRINEGTGIPGEQDIPHDDIEVLLGGAGDDWIQGAAANNLLVGNGGNDTIIGMGGNDTLVGGLGIDLLGHDPLEGGPGAADGDAGDDVMYTFDMTGDHDGSTDRISDTIGTNTLHYSLTDPDVILSAIAPPVDPLVLS